MPKTSSARRATPSPSVPSRLDQLHAQELTQHVARCLDVIREMDARLGGLPQSADADARGAFSYIRYDLDKFLLMLRHARLLLEALGRKPPYRFLDVGCGIGTKVLFAASYFERAEGIEFDTGYIQAGRKLFVEDASGKSSVALLQADALRFRHYAAYDVIYLYRPFTHFARQKRLERTIARAARNEAVILAPLCDFDQMPATEGIVTVQPEVHLKAVSPRRLGRLRRCLAIRHFAWHPGPDLAATRGLRKLARRLPPGTGVNELVAGNPWQQAELNRALDALGRQARRAADVATLMIFGDATLEEAACVYGISTSTAGRDWRDACRFLRHHLKASA